MRDHRHRLRQQVRLHRQRRHRGARHGDRAQMPGLDLRRDIEFCRAHHFRRTAGRLAVRGPRSNCARRHGRCAPSARDRPDETRPRRAGCRANRRFAVSACSRWRCGPAPPSRPNPSACRIRTIPFAPPRRHWPPPPPTSGRSSANRSTSSNGGDWLKTSWVADEVWVIGLVPAGNIFRNSLRRNTRDITQTAPTYLPRRDIGKS